MFGNEAVSAAEVESIKNLNFTAPEEVTNATPMVSRFAALILRRFKSPTEFKDLKRNVSHLLTAFRAAVIDETIANELDNLEAYQYRDELYARAVEVFGKEMQMRQVKEELFELGLAVSHYQRDKVKKEDVAAEIADVECMIEQLKLMLSIDAATMAKARHQKIKKLKAMLDKYGV